MITKPFKRIIRPIQLSPIKYSEGGTDPYFVDDEYAADRISLTRAYHILEQDLRHLFEYVEPDDGNLNTYSHRLYELLLRASTEFETNCKSILLDNQYQKKGRLDITDYHKVNTCSRMSEYEIVISIWRSGPKVFKPFEEWSVGHSLSWYQAYNDVKHNRTIEFSKANLNHVISAVSAVLALLFSQFYYKCFSPRGDTRMYIGAPWYTSTDTIFAIKGPTAWTSAECYKFDWSSLQNNTDRFDTFF
ncbi:MAG: hypothetical protein O2955_05785 [Planctomycetota bacterium]|nr:hypothetical protein [Planctomycetota bacterium]MDA1212004.1 hypothetical protein [Planctomycetota bacterium]